MKKTKLLLALAMAVLTSAPAAGQKKSPVEKRERFEFSFELPAYVEQLKQELTRASRNGRRRPASGCSTA